MKIIQTQVNNLKNKKLLSIVKHLSFHCAKLYNVGLYSVKTYYEQNDEYLPYSKNYHACKTNENYKLLLTDTGQKILRMVERDMKSFFALLRTKSKGKYSGKVCTPHYKKTFMTVSVQGRSCRIKNQKIHIGMTKEFREKYSINQKDIVLDLPKNLNITKLREIRFVPNSSGKQFKINFVYDKEYDVTPISSDYSLGIDLGINNFAACVNSDTGESFLLDGRKIKSVNQLYNKIKSKTQPQSRKRERWSNKRYNQINDIFNKYANYVVDYCIDSNLSQIVIGELTYYKDKVNLGKINNQTFVGIPYGKFIRKLKSKCIQNGIQLHLQEESYTSKCSFLDNEKVQKQDSYIGKRVKRGLFKCGNSQLVNADCNGAANILRKHRASFGGRVCSGFVANPTLVKV